jgi:hypothetical protein
MNKVAIITFEWKNRNLHQCINDCKILSICNYENIENDLNLNKYAEWNFFHHGFTNYKNSDVYVILLEQCLKKRELYIDFLKKFEIKSRKNKLLKIGKN